MNILQKYTKPSLIEPGVRYFFSEALKKCHTFKENYHNLMINIGLLICFIIILGIILLFKYKGKLTPEEIRQKELDKKKYILSKIKNYQDTRKREEQELITGLPHWENEFTTM
jgi:hypothetical protein